MANAETDQNCLAEAVYFESRGESEAGQQAVAQVVLNRVRHPAFPKTVCGVVHQRTAFSCQFAFACTSERPATGTAAWRRSEDVASAALHGTVMAAVGDATHFQSARGGPFGGLLKVAQVGAHVFYRFAGHAGSPGMFDQTPAPSAVHVVDAKADPERAAPPKAEVAKTELARADDAPPHPVAGLKPDAIPVRIDVASASPLKPAAGAGKSLVTPVRLVIPMPGPAKTDGQRPASSSSPDGGKPAPPAASKAEVTVALAAS